jgi:hypothetical protein
MTLTILDPRSGNKVIIHVDDVAVVRPATPARIAVRPRFGEARPS